MQNPVVTVMSLNIEKATTVATVVASIVAGECAKGLSYEDVLRNVVTQQPNVVQMTNPSESISVTIALNGHRLRSVWSNEDKMDRLIRHAQNFLKALNVHITVEQ